MCKEIEVEHIVHRNEKRIKLIFSRDDELYKKIRSLPGVRWSQTLRCWHIPYRTDYRDIIRTCIDTDIEIIQSENSFIERKDIDIKKIEINIAINKKEGIVYIKMPYIEDCVYKIRGLPGAWWHPGIKLWSVYYNTDNITAIKGIFDRNDYNLHFKETDSNVFESRVAKDRASRSLLPKEYIVQLKLENKSKRTIEVYTGFIAQFLKDFKSRDIKALSDEEIRDYILEHREQRGYSESYQNQMVSAIRSYYRNQFRRDFEPGILPRPKKGRYLPKILPREDIQRIIEVCRNEKHKMILLMLYGFGLRLNEIVNLKVIDIDFERRQLTVCKGKGRKDRILPVPLSIIPYIRKYLKSYLPKDFFVSGQFGEQYSSSSIQSIVRNMAERAGIRRRVTPHMLRHCYATHMLERGTDLRYIQNLLGHKSSKTTEIYTHVSMQKLTDLANPLDDIDF